MNIIVVGNGPVYRQLEETINKFDVVIRVNNYSTDKKYRKYIGTKTDIWAICGPMSNEEDYKRGAKCTIWPLFPYHAYDAVEDMIPIPIRKRFDPIDVSVTKELQRKVGYHTRAIMFTRTGLTAIEYALHVYGGPIYTTGFTHTDEHIYPVKLKDKNFVEPCHSLKLDRYYYNGLVHYGKVVEL